MLELFRMQIRHMLGGRRKWLVALCLVLPVLLTVAASSSGGLAELEREVEAERGRLVWTNGGVPDTARQLVWEGEDLEFLDGLIRLTSEGLQFSNRTVSGRNIVIVNDGYLVLRGSELWIDPARQREGRGIRWQMSPLPSRETPVRRSTEVLPIETFAAVYLFLLYPLAICLLLALFYGTSVLGEELDGKTLTYLFTRPVPRWQFVVGKYLGIVTALALPTALSLVASWAATGGLGGPRLLLAVLVGTMGALLCYNALFVLFGFAIPRRAMIVALLYGVVVELILSFVPAVVNEFTVTYYLRSVVVGMLDLEIPREIARMVGGASVPVALSALALIVVLPLAVSAVLAARREYVVKDTA